jgi:hypothetical protein
MKRFVLRAIECENRCYFSKHINASLHNSKKLWQNLKTNLLSHGQKVTDLPPHFDDSDVINDHFLIGPGDDKVTISQLTFFEYHRHFFFSRLLRGSIQMLKV